ncbi:MAG: tRNA (adenosine(37)-N6)-threonylcarbamoyltransferase complex ATPase subunit type 1 TsaE [Schwartzia succinivorans]|nr:tRNA (adenosine(37)-N6)-threonylcarbamoyltransferase complex ATPase subunit type 1 TsaE [Schwartzia succinivorans]
MQTFSCTVVTHAPQETAALAERLGAAAETGTVLCLVGDLGAGKTLFTQGFARGLGVTEEVTSPTFALMNQYCGRLPVTHFDLYRLEREEELDEIGFYEFAEPSGGVVLIEWADKFPDALPKPHIRLEIERGEKENERRLMFFTTEEDSALWRALMEK